MAMPLSGSVGVSGMNRRQDTITVQTLLTRAGLRLGLVDGLCGPKTISAIVRYQRGFLRTPDGLIEPGATTWRHLTGGRANAAPSATRPGAAAQRVPAAAMRAPARTPVGRAALPTQAARPTPAPNSNTSFTTLLPRPDRNTINAGLSSPSNKTLLGKFGSPRENYSQHDQPMTNSKLLALMTTQSVGPFRAYGMRSAVESLARVLSDVQRDIPELYNSLSSAGMTVVRNVRGSSTSISNHSWGTAIDLKINGKLDVYGDGKVFHGLLLLAPYFNKHGWYWGAAFRKEDSMHFECSASLISSFPNP